MSEATPTPTAHPIVIPKREVRCCTGLEIREAAKDSGSIATLVGYAAVWNQRSEVMYDFVEIVKPGAFKRSLSEGSDVRAMGHHTKQFIIGRRSAGTLRVEEDDKGLRYEIDLPDTTYGRDLRESVKRRDITGSSFSFEKVKDNWYRDQGDEKLLVRELLDVNLFELGPVVWPAYPHTSVDTRSIEDVSREARSRLSPPPPPPKPPTPAALTPEQLARRDLVTSRYRLIRDLHAD